MYSVSDETRKPIFEGVQGENEAREIQFDVTAWVEELGEGVCTATAKRPTDTAPYPVTVTRSGNVVTWKPNSADTSIEGIGAFQLAFSINDVVAKTRIWNTKIAPSLVGAGDPPAPYDDWIQDLRDIAAETLTYSQNAANSADDAQDSADAAAASAASIAGDHDELINIRVGADGTTYSNAGDAVRGQVSDLRDDLEEVVDGYNNLRPYFYKKDKYINASNVETTLAGYNLYKIPVSNLDVVHMKWDTVAKFWNAISSSYVMRWEKSDNTYRTATNNGEMLINEAEKELIVIAPNDAINLCICAYGEYAQYVSVNKNIGEVKLKPNVQKLDYVAKLSEDNSILSHFYLANSNVMGIWTASVSPRYISYFIKVKAGDRITWEHTITQVSRCGMFRKADGTASEILLGNEWIFTQDGLANIYDEPTTTGGVTFYPVDSIKLEGKNIVGDVASNNPFNGLNAVAFGTSLTYRAQTTGGFLQYLPNLSGMTFDNQGIGSSVILGNMLTAIKNYNSYADKDICLLEGFTNDWYYNPGKLGTWKDTGETTVCGCVRSALNYILTQNANITIYLILDHYGKGISASTELNTANLTQFEYYEEIAKVAESLSVPVIKEYAISGMCENTPQYFIDNIHPNTLGAKQSAYAIWSQLKQYYPNQK